MSPARPRFVPLIVAMRLAAVLVAWACVQPLPAWAQVTVTWDGSTNTTWSQPDTTSWSGATYNSGNTALFNGSGTGTVTIDAGGVTPGQTNVTAGSYSFSGGPLGGSGGIAKSGAGTLTLTGSSDYSGMTSITGGVLNIQNASALGGTAAGTTVASGATLQIQGGITVTGESLSLIGAGVSTTGALRNISGSNTWTGAIGIDGVAGIGPNGDLTQVRIHSDGGSLTLSGPIQIAAPAASGSASAMLVTGAGNVQISGNIGGGKAGNVSYVTSGGMSGTNTLSGSNSYLGWTIANGNLTLDGGFAIPDDSRVVMSGANGRLVLNASETIGGLASSSAATQINLNSHTLTIGADNTTPLASNIGGAEYLGGIIGTGGIVKVGAGTLALSGSSSYSGGTTVSAGELSISNTAALGATSGSLAVNGGTLRLNGVSVTVGALSGSSGATITTNTTSGTRILTTSATSSSTFAGTIADNGSGSVALVKSGTGTLTLTGSSAYSGTTSITAGMLTIQNASALGGTAAGTTVANGAALQIQGGITVSGESLSLAFGGPDGLTGALRNISGSNTWTGAIGIDGVAGIGANGDVSQTRIGSEAGSLTLTGPIQVAAPAASGSASALLVIGAGNVQIAGNMSGGKAGNLSFISSSGGTGIRTLSGSNSYLGWTAVHGNLTLDGGFAIPDTSRVVSDSALGRLVLNASETIGGLASSVTGMQINLNSHTLTIGADNTTPLSSNMGGAGYLGTIIGTGGIVKVGTGGLTLSGSNSYSGPTIISGGTLALGLNGSFASSPTITVGDAGSSGAVLDLTAKTGTFAFTDSQTVGGIGTLRVGDTAAFAGVFAPGNSAGIFTLDGGTTLLSGTTQIEILGAARGTGYDAVDLVNSAVLNYGNGVLTLDFGSWLGQQQAYQLFGTGSSTVGGSFSSVSITGTNYAGLAFTGSNGVWTSQGTSPANQTLTFTEATGTLVIVPEPGALALAGIGVAMAIRIIRRRM